MKFSSIDFKMALLKKTINLVAPRVLRLSKGVQPKTPQARLVEKVWARLEDVYEKEALTGCFHDKDFQNLLETAKQALIFLCENDKYYKRWLGLLAMFLTEETSKTLRDLSYEDALELYARPMMLSREECERHKLSIAELYLSGYLYGMSLLHESDKPKIEKARIEHKNVSLPSRDCEAIFKLFFVEREKIPSEEER